MLQTDTSSDDKNVYAVARGRENFDGNVVVGHIGVLFKASTDGGRELR